MFVKPVYFFDSEEEFLSCNTSEKFSIIGEASKYPRINNRYEFLLEYPELNGQHNRWYQDVFPTEYEEDRENTVPGFDCFDCDWESFTGLCMSKDSTTFVEGQCNSWQYFFSIGQRKTWTLATGTVGVIGPIEVAVQEVYLWMRILRNRTSVINTFHISLPLYSIALYSSKYN